MLGVALAAYYWEVLFLGRLVDGSDLVYARYAPWILAPPDGFTAASNLALNDSVISFAPAMSFVRDSIWSGQLPLWNPYTEFGMPFYAQTQWGVLSPAQLPYLALPPGVSVYTAGTLAGMLKLAIAGSGTYLLARRLAIETPGALFAAIAFMFSGYMTAWLGMPASAIVAFFPWILLGVEATLLGRRYVLGAALLAASLAACVAGGHPEVILYVIYGFVAYAATRVVQERRRLAGQLRRRLLAGTAATALAVGVTAIVLIPASELYFRSADEAQRSDKSFQSIKWSDLAFAINPDRDGSPLDGGAGGVAYAVLSAPLYLGFAPLALGLVALLFRDRRVVPFVVLMVMTLVIATAPGWYRALVQDLPIIGRAFYVHVLLLWPLPVAMLGGIGLDRFGRLLERRGQANRPVWRGLAVAAPVALCVVVFAELYSWGHDYNPRVPRQTVGIPSPPELAAIPAGRGAPRTAFLGGAAPPPLLPMLFERPEVRGYGQPTREDYDRLMREAVAKYGPGYLSYVSYSLLEAQPSMQKVLAAANVEYLAYTRFQPQDAKLVRHFPGARLVRDGKLVVLAAPRPMPRAYVVSRWETRDGDTAIDRLTERDFDPTKSVVLDSPPEGVPPRGPEPAAQPRITHYGNGRVEATVRTDRPGVLVLSDSHYPGWRVAVDGERRELLRANGLFRGVALPAGEHTVEFTFRPTSVVVGGVISLASVVLLVLVAFLGRRRVLEPAPG